jgi:hypothetical protein
MDHGKGRLNLHITQKTQLNFGFDRFVRFIGRTSLSELVEGMLVLLRMKNSIVSEET